jgi:hypothetical protein
MTQTIIISEQDFEAARRAFVTAWQKQDKLLTRLGLSGEHGTRTRSGLIAALAELGIATEGAR